MDCLLRESQIRAPCVNADGNEKANNLSRALTPVVHHKTKDLPRV
ncbi:hypothetical protein PI125_g3330 [Phytophthora idaei]|nr:hypothetical protein PI125_g3330 [Phytophthora idaei]